MQYGSYMSILLLQEDGETLNAYFNLYRKAYTHPFRIRTAMVIGKGFQYKNPADIQITRGEVIIEN
jgi:hypothetical protein